MAELWQMLTAAVVSSGVVGAIVAAVVNNQVSKQYAARKAVEDLRDANELLMMDRIDNAAEMTHLMARKLHDAGIINGDLAELDKKNAELNQSYEKNMKELARKVLYK